MSENRFLSWIPKLLEIAFNNVISWEWKYEAEKSGREWEKKPSYEIIIRGIGETQGERDKKRQEWEVDETDIVHNDDDNDNIKMKGIMFLDDIVYIWTVQCLNWNILLGQNND